MGSCSNEYPVPPVPLFARAWGCRRCRPSQSLTGATLIRSGLHGRDRSECSVFLFVRVLPFFFLRSLFPPSLEACARMCSTIIWPSEDDGVAPSFDQSLHHPSDFSRSSLVLCFQIPESLLLMFGLIRKIAALSALLSKMIPNAYVLSDRLYTLVLKILLSSIHPSNER